jgi:hypothetical protein
MFRFLARVVGFLLVAAAFLVAVVDGTRAIGSGAWRPVKVGDIWNAIDTSSLQLAQAAVERHIAAFLWDPVALAVLTAPAFAVFGGLGVVLMLLGRRREVRRIGYGRD